MWEEGNAFHTPLLPLHWQGSSCCLLDSLVMAIRQCSRKEGYTSAKLKTFMKVNSSTWREVGIVQTSSTQYTSTLKKN